MYLVVKKRTDGRDSEKPQYVTFTGNKDVQKYFNLKILNLHHDLAAIVYMWSKKVRIFSDYFAYYEQLHRYRLEAAQAEEEKKTTIAELTFETMYRL